MGIGTISRRTALAVGGTVAASAGLATGGALVARQRAGEEKEVPHRLPVLMGLTGVALLSVPLGFPFANRRVAGAVTAALGGWTAGEALFARSSSWSPLSVARNGES